MIILSKTSNLPLILKASAILGVTEVLFSILFRYLGLEDFQMVPYLRLVTTVFLIAYLFYKKLIIKDSIKRIVYYNSLNNKLVFYWILITLICLIVGIFRLNPILYIITDFFYIFFGFLFYRIIQTSVNINSEIQKLEINTVHNTFIILLLLLSIICLFSKINIPSFLLVLSLSFSFFFFFKKKHLYTFLYFIPFIIQFTTANRAILIVFLLFATLSFFNRPISEKTLFKVISLSVTAIIVTPYILSFSIKQILPLISDGSVLKARLDQVKMLMEGKYNWNSPEMLSLKQRIDEVLIVLKFWTANVFNFVFGGGLGATIEGHSFKDVGVGSSAILGKEKIHNIHILPFSLIFRYGLFGLILFYLLLKNLFFNLFKVLTTKNSIYSSLILFQISWIIYSLPAASFLWTSPIFWFLLAFDYGKNK